MIQFNRADKMTNYIKKKCTSCKQIFELRKDMEDTLYAEFCSTCFFDNVVEDIYGALRLKTKKEKEKDTSYKDELQEVTHRGKIKV